MGFCFMTNLLSGQYTLGVDIAAADLSHYYDRIDDAVSFTVQNGNQAHGLVDLEASFHIITNQSV
jgi:hypothetical protein